MPYGRMRVRYRPKDRDDLGRMMRAEAAGEGKVGMLRVGNVILNMTEGCPKGTFGDAHNNLHKAIFHSHYNKKLHKRMPDFSALLYGEFYRPVGTLQRRLADQAIRGWRKWPSSYALWYQNPSYKTPGKKVPCPKEWLKDTRFAGRAYGEHHCFYSPTGYCYEVLRRGWLPKFTGHKPARIPGHRPGRRPARMPGHRHEKVR